MGSQISLTVSIVMFALFVVAILSFAIGFANDNNAYIDISNDSELMNLNTNLDSNLSTFTSESQDTYASIINTTIESGSDVAKSPASFSITFSNIFGVATNIFRVGYQKIFGSDDGFDVFFIILTSLIVFIAGLYIYKALRGNP